MLILGCDFQECRHLERLKRHYTTYMSQDKKPVTSDQ